MAWAERTIHDVSDPPTNKVKADEDRINEILKNMPPFIKLSSRRARKTLAKYEEVKQRHIENLRNNPVFKFVMMVAGFTNENMQKYWKGSDVSPFQEGYGPKDVKIDKEEIELLVRRARERAFADLHQFCRPIPAIPVFRMPKNSAGVDTENERQVARSLFSNRRSKRARSDEAKRRNVSEKRFTKDDGARSSANNSNDGEKNPNSTPYDGQDRYARRVRKPVSNSSLTSKQKYIYNMSDMEFRDFCKRFVEMNFTKSDTFEENGSNNIYHYVLGDHDALPKKKFFPAHKHQRSSNNQSGFRESTFTGEDNTYNEETGEGVVPADESTGQSATQRNQGVDRVFEDPRIYDANGNQRDSYEHKNPYVSLTRSDWMQWSDNNPPVHWNDTYAAFWFQRYIARWLVREENATDDNNTMSSSRFTDLRKFKNRYGIMFNNLFLEDPALCVWYRDFTGLRLTKMIRGMKRNNEGYSIDEGEEEEGDYDFKEPCEVPCEVPLDFVRPLFNERFSFWKHELVLGEYEKRTMYEADQWLQKTPWAIGKIYLQPNIYSHMQEAHIAITSKFKKFQSLSLQDWLTNEKHMFFYAKLVALCIRTSVVLSNKKYGLDKAYMRLNLEKRRIMYSLSKMEKPKKMIVARVFPRASANQERLWEEYRSARARGDTAGAQAILEALN